MSYDERVWEHAHAHANANVFVSELNLLWKCTLTRRRQQQRRRRLLVAQQIRNFRSISMVGWQAADRTPSLPCSDSSPSTLYDRLSRQSNYMHEHVVVAVAAASPSLVVHIVGFYTVRMALRRVNR